MRIFSRELFLILAIFLCVGSFCYGQDTQQLLGEVAKVYTGSQGSDSGLIAGFSLAGLIGGIIFSGIGFIAFVYGKKNSEFRPLILGILLMGYPYFVKGTLFLYLTGIVLTVLIFIWRE